MAQNSATPPNKSSTPSSGQLVNKNTIYFTIIALCGVWIVGLLSFYFIFGFRFQ